MITSAVPPRPGAADFKVSAHLVVRGETFVVWGRRDRSFLSFWVERVAGRLWRHINEPESQWSGLDQSREILIATGQDDALLGEVITASGWFDRTTKSSPDPELEVWRLTDKCLQAMGLVLTEDEPPASLKLSAYLSIWSKQYAQLHIAGALVAGPTPQPGSRRLIGVFPDTLQPAAAQFLLDSGLTRAAASAYPLTPRDEPTWRRRAAALGFQSCAHVHMPAAAGRFFDIVLLSMREFGQAAHISEVALAVFNHWQDMRAALASDGPLSQREIECLEHTANGLNAQECALQMGCSESNVRQHLSRAMRKLAAPSTVSTIRRAQLFGLL